MAYGEAVTPGRLAGWWARRGAAALAGAGVVFGLGLLAAGAAPKAGDKAPGRYIVVLRAGADADAVADRHGLAIEHRFDAVFRGFSAKGAEGRLTALQDDPDVERAEPDRYVEAFGQTLPRGINRIDADLSATAAIDGTDTRVNADIAVIDTGIDKKHADLNVASGYNCTTSRTTNWGDGNGHGTHVAGTAAAKDNGIGVVGAAPGARLWAVKVLDNSGSGFVSWVICGVNFVTKNAGTIEAANMSLGGQFSSATLDTAIANSVAAGVAYAAAAGNSAKDAATFSPAKHPDVLAISAVADSDGRCGGLGPSTPYGADDTFASFSNFGSVVDLAAPGVSILSTYKGGGYATGSGTSMASPHAAGAAALLLATKGRDVNGDGAVNGADVAAVRDTLITGGVAQTQACEAALNDGFGGFTGDPDATAEPLVYAKAL